MNTFDLTDSVERHIPNILIVEDDLDDQMFLRIAFRNTAKKISLHVVSTAKEALTYLQHTPDHMLPDLIVIDFSLPGTNGIKLKQQLNTMERYAAIKKVILSDSMCFPVSGNKNVYPKNCFLKPDSFAGLKRLAEQLLQLSSQMVMFV